MKLLAFDTSTDHISIALTCPVDGVAQVWQHDGAGGALASGSLIPAIEALMAQAGLRYAALDAIAFGQGPGSFTGLRTACAVAQGLAFGAGIPVLPVDTLLMLAEQARCAHFDTAASVRVLWQLGGVWSVIASKAPSQWPTPSGSRHAPRCTPR